MSTHTGFKLTACKHISLMMFLLSPTTALAQDLGFYAEVYGGARLQSKIDTIIAEFDTATSPIYGAAIGLLTPIDGLSFELDLMRSSIAIASNPGNFSSTSIFINAEYNLHVGDMFDLYAGAGLGSLGFVYSDDAANPDNGFGYQLIAGGRVKMTDHVSVFAEYKYASMFNDFDGGSVFEKSIASHNILSGLRFSF